MRKILFILSVLLLLTGCTRFKIKKTATEYIKQNEIILHNEVEVTKIINDTIPWYFDCNLREDLAAFDEALAAFNEANKGELRMLTQEIRDKKLRIRRSFNEAIKRKKGYIVYTKTIIDRDSILNQILIIDENNTDKVLNYIHFDDSYMSYLCNLFLVLAMPVEYNDNGVFDFKVADEFYRRNITEIEIAADRIYAKHEKYFK